MLASTDRSLKLPLVGFLLIWAAGCSQEETITWGHASTEPSSSFVEVLSQEASTDTEQFASVEALTEAVRTRAIDFAILEQPSKHIEGVSVVASVFPSVLHILVKRDVHDCSGTLPMSSLLDGKTIYAGSVGSTGYTLLEQLGETEWLPPMSELSLLPDPFGNQPDIYFQFGGLLPIDAVRRLDQYCLASVGDASEIGKGSWADGIGFRFPHLDPFVLPAGVYPRLNDAPVLTLSVSSLLVTSTDTNEELVYDIAERVEEEVNRLSEIYPLAAGSIHANLMEQRIILPIHAGAARFSLRNAPTLLERYAETGALILTALIALSSASFGIYRMRRQTKKDRIDAFLKILLGHRETIRQEPPKKRHVAEEIRELQNKVTQLVIEERIHADSAYVAFLDLSNQILRECDETQSA